MDKASTIAAVCEALRSDARDARDAAGSILKRDYPFTPEPVTKRVYGPVEATRVFVRHGFLDRYTGERLDFSPVLRVIAAPLPNEFPYHPNWKTDVMHSAFWEMGATVDHVMPVTRGGADDDSNWVTTSMARNSAKGNRTLEELGWRLHPGGDFGTWDGLLRWYVQVKTEQSALLQDRGLRAWYKAARQHMFG